MIQSPFTPHEIEMRVCILETYDQLPLSLLALACANADPNLDSCCKILPTTVRSPLFKTTYKHYYSQDVNFKTKN